MGGKGATKSFALFVAGSVSCFGAINAQDHEAGSCIEGEMEDEGGDGVLCKLPF
jgi:hypothetical protein